jgi:ribose-phosphate pyrophosphokinase
MPKLKPRHPGGMIIVTTPSMSHMSKQVHVILESKIKKKSIDYSEIKYEMFSRREVLPIIQGNVRGKHVYLFLDFNGADWMRDVFVSQLTISAIQDAGADKITLVIPTFPGQRQDRKDRSRVPISAKVVIRSLTLQFETVVHVITLDMHAEQLEAVFPRAPDHLPGFVGFAPWILETFKDQMEDVVIVCPDAGSVKRNQRLAKRVKAPLAFLAKDRKGRGKNEVTAVHGEDVSGKICVTNDDLLDTCGTMAKSAVTLFEKGASEVWLTGTHAVFGGDAYETLAATGCQVVVTDSLITQPHEWLTVLPLAPYLAEVILQNNIEDGSVSTLIEQGIPS